MVILPTAVSAAGLVPCGGPTEKACTFVDFFGAVARLVNMLIALAGVYAVIQIIYAGFGMIMAQGNEEAIAAKKSQITAAIVGMVIALMSYAIINTAVNIVLMSRCKIDLKNPLNYLKPNTCNPAGNN